MQIVTKEKKATNKHAAGKIRTCVATKGCTQWGGNLYVRGIRHTTTALIVWNIATHHT